MRALSSVLLALTASACVAGVDGESAKPGAPPETETGFVAHERGLDYAWSRPSSPQALKNAGYTFVARYLSYDTSGKNLTAGEAQQLFGAGVDVVANWEWGANDALNGYNTGRTQAQKALDLANGCGMPADRPIYFSVDFDAAESQQPALDDYFAGVASVLGVERTGAYGGYWVIKRLFDDGKIKWGWQTYAWSGGNWDARAQLRQIQNGVTIAGADSDIDEAEADDFGQWGPNAPPASTAAPDEGGQAFLEPGEQHYLTTGNGSLLHAWWDQTANQVQKNSWGSGVTGRPVTFTYGDEQHAFARGTSGTLEHWFWKPSLGLSHDTWASGLAADPAAVIIGPYQDVWGVDGSGNLQHWWWSPNNDVKHDTWGTGVTGRPTILLYGPQQHVFARGTGGTLEHFFLDPQGGIQHDTWGSGIASDPAALHIGDFQDVWAIDGAGALQHWWWGPATNGVQHDTWGQGVTGRPAVLLSGGQQHVFARGTGGTLEHFYWDPMTGNHHDTWGQGIVTDPTAEAIANQQHVWAEDSAGTTQHWYWDPAANAIQHDSW